MSIICSYFPTNSIDQPLKASSPSREGRSRGGELFLLALPPPLSLFLFGCFFLSLSSQPIPSPSFSPFAYLLIVLAHFVVPLKEDSLKLNPQIFECAPISFVPICLPTSTARSLHTLRSSALFASNATFHIIFQQTCNQLFFQLQSSTQCAPILWFSCFCVFFFFFMYFSFSYYTFDE